MSGLAVAFGNPDQHEIEAIMSAISHRGIYISGINASNNIILAQNYLEADGAVGGNSTMIPVRSLKNPHLMVCYDGQIGNLPDMGCEYNIPDGPFMEERLLLALYEEYGKEMLGYLTDAIFSFVITDGKELFAARDLLGIKTLFYGKKNGTLYLASELKGILKVTPDVYEFPNGCFMDSGGRFTRFGELPKQPPKYLDKSVDEMTADIRDIIARSFNNRVDFSVPTGGLLSGGMDSSVINYLAGKAYKEKFGPDARLKTYAIGVGESGDVVNARVVASQIDSEHHELNINIEQMLDVLPEVIYYLESFDPSLVRSSVSNYIISRYAKEQGIRIILSGEGGDEVFCGYLYLGQCPAEELFARQMECIGFLHNNASLRLDRMNMCNSIRVVTPLISGELLRYAMTIPPQYKQRPDNNQKIEKWIFRKAYEGLLPDSIVWRRKQEFSQGSGSADVLKPYFEDRISNSELTEAQSKYPVVRSKEELYYFRLFTENFGTGSAVDTVGQWISL